MKITITLPRLPAGAAPNIVGLLGLVAVSLAIGGLVGSWWWSILTGGAFAVILAAIAQSHTEAERAESRPAAGPAAAPYPRGA